MKKITLNVDEKVYEKFQELVRAEGSSVAVEIRRFMKKYVEENK